ncbi:MAG TPA: hypothetical protein VKS03_02520 [Thermoanaerobaculia bacterium]|nr:hypothetical protein [Thermoanaerobaculia bacterium]
MRNRQWRSAGARWLTSAAVLLCAASLRAQVLPNLEPERPLTIEDATPIPFRALSVGLDWTYNFRRSALDDEGPGLTVTYGALRNLEVGAAQRYVTRPGRNALRGISSGDLEFHALYGVVEESARHPALAARIGVVLPTGLDSRGTDLELGAIGTRSFEKMRAHASFRWTRLGDILPGERADRLEGGVAVDFLASAAGRTDTLILAGVTVRSSLVVNENAIVDVEAGVRQRIGIQTVVFGSIGSQITGRSDRTQVRLRAGISHLF